jgi:ech hydrogenase subunit B
VRLPLIFLGFCYILTVKLRKSPFDLSTSHHGHQEIVKGVTTELTGVCLAMVEITHWYETMFALGIVYLFFVWSAPYSRWIALLCCLAVYLAEIFVDNGLARVKWRAALKSSWLVTGVLGGINLFVLNLLR